jgi:ADP-heptose:LPS heptosyltransferase
VKILISIACHIGDNVCHEPAIRAIREKYPDAELTIATLYPAIFAGYPFVDKVIPYQRGQNEKHENYDLHFYRDEIKHPPHFVDHLAVVAGVELKDRIPKLSVSEVEVSTVIEKFGIDFNIPTIIIHAEPTTTNRQWRIDRWKMLCLKLSSDFQIVQVGVRKSTIRCNYVHSLVGKTSLREMMIMVSMCKLVICVDSGIAHIATAFGVPNVVLFGTADPLSLCHPGFTYPVEAQACHICRKLGTLNGICRIGLHECMNQIRVDMVLNAVKKVIADKNIQLGCVLNECNK